MITETYFKYIRVVPYAAWLFLIWLLAIFLVNPIGDFPLNDDWSYARSVWNLCQQGKLTMEDWPGMTLVSQVFWGALFCKIFGLSFTALRISSLVAAFVGVFTFYKLSCHLGAEKKMAAFISLLLLFNPLFFSLSFTFMTDVPFAATLLLAIYFFSKYLQRNKPVFILFAAIFSVISTMVRQPGIIVPLVFIFPIIYIGRNFRSVVISLLPFLSTVAALIIHSFWLQHLNTLNKVGHLGDLAESLASLNFKAVQTRFSMSLLYSGLFLSPLILLFLGRIITTLWRKSYLWLIAIFLFAIFLRDGGKVFPGGNILYNCGIGPKLLIDSFWQQNITPFVPNPVWGVILKLISFPAAISILILLARKLSVLKKLLEPGDLQYILLTKLCLLMMITGYMAFLIVNDSFFDRYTIPLFTLLALVIIPYGFQLSKPLVALAAISLPCLFSICATHDYLSWNRARWKAIHFLVEEKKINPKEIDGGFEYNWWKQTGYRTDSASFGKSPWFSGNAAYALSFGEIQGFKKYNAVYYPQWLTPSSDSIYILEASYP